MCSAAGIFVRSNCHWQPCDEGVPALAQADPAGVQPHAPGRGAGRLPAARAARRALAPRPRALVHRAPAPHCGRPPARCHAECLTTGSLPRDINCFKQRCSSSGAILHLAASDPPPIRVMGNESGVAESAMVKRGMRSDWLRSLLLTMPLSIAEWELYLIRSLCLARKNTTLT